MADHPKIAAAKEALRDMVPEAVEQLGDLIQSEHDGIRLAASKEVLDRGGVPAKADHTLHVDLTLDDEIEQLLRTLGRNKDREALKAELSIEDAIVVEDAVEIEAGGPETVLKAEGKLPGEYQPPEPEPVPAQEADPWWQATPAPRTSLPEATPLGDAPDPLPGDDQTQP